MYAQQEKQSLLETVDPTKQSVYSSSMFSVVKSWDDQNEVAS